MNEEKVKKVNSLILSAQSARESGQILTCEQKLKSAIDLLEGTEDTELLKIKARALNLLANTLTEVRRFDEAETLYCEAKDIYQNNLHTPDKESFILHGLGNLYFSKGDIEKSIEFYEDSLSIKRKLSLKVDDILPSLYGLALCYMKTKNFNEALNIIDEYALKIYNKDDPQFLELWTNYHAYQNDWPKAIDKLKKLQIEAKKAPTSWRYIMVEMSLAKAYNFLNDHETAEKYFWKSFSALEKKLSTLLSSPNREGLRKNFLNGIEEQFQIWRGRAESNKIENYKILNIIERLSAIEVRSKFDYKGILAEINDSTLKSLSDGEIILYLFGTNSALYTLIMDNSGLVLDDSSGFSDECRFDTLSDYNYLSPLSDEQNDDFIACFKTIVITALLLYLVPKEIKKICLLFPFGKANNIPWDYFIHNANQFSNKQRSDIFKTTPISRLPSFSIYLTLKKITSLNYNKTSPVVFANPLGPFTPLPETIDETKEIKNIFPETRIFKGKSASIGELVNIYRPSFLHISCHGEFNEKNPLKSTLLLSSNDLSLNDEKMWMEWQQAYLRFKKQNPKAKLEDFNLTFPTQYNGSINASYFRLLELKGTEFVFLAACAVGKVSYYDEIQGFAQSVFLAECPNLIAPLWPVNTEAASIFVKEFYKEYKNLTQFGLYRNDKIGKCVVLAKNALWREGFKDQEIAAWTVFGIG